MTDHSTLHFSLGPVQGFIGQARRTRDLWAGSFLLSWLSGQAMAEFPNPKDIIFPKIEDDPLYKAICGDQGVNPRIATLPNRFQAKVSGDFDAHQLTSKINQKWKDLADAVYAQFIIGKEASDTKEIWDRQIDNFWEVQWVLGDDTGDLLDKRKNWRSQSLMVEGGKHCTTMGDYQELSGHTNAKQQEEFWNLIRQGVNADRLNLRPNERLCAIALVKRLFVYLHKDKLTKIIGWIPGGDKSNLTNFPSTTYMAAVPWLAHIQEKNENQLTAYKDYIANKTPTVFDKLCGEYPTDLTCLNPKEKHKNWSDLDGNLFNQTALMNWRSTVLSDSNDYFEKNKVDPNNTIRQEILDTLKKLPSKSSNFYALLLMDGDSLGKLLQNNKKNPALVSEHLAKFANDVDKIVTKNCGVTIYAGGDDVLALMPIHKAIDCAQALNHCYENAFNKSGVKGKTTLSGAIVFSHYHNPFTQVLKEARHQLNGIAKDDNDRDSLAIAILKPGNLSAQWVNKWRDAHFNELENIVKKLHSNELPHGFFYKITERYQAILKQAFKQNKSLFSAILKAELKKTKEKSIDIDIAVTEISKICQPNNIDKNTPQLSSLYLARFLATEDKSLGKPK